jgi:hypothetical protein
MYGSQVVHRFPTHRRAPKHGIDIRRRKKVILSNRRKRDRADKKFVAGLLKRSVLDSHLSDLYRMLHQHAKRRFELGHKLDLIRRLAGQLERGRLTSLDLQAELFPHKRHNPDRRVA